MRKPKTDRRIKMRWKRAHIILRARNDSGSVELINANLEQLMAHAQYQHGTSVYKAEIERFTLLVMVPNIRGKI